MNRLLIILLCILTCCVADRSFMPEEGTVQTKSATKPVVIVNDADGISLFIDSCNASDMVPAVMGYGDTLVLEGCVMEPDTVLLYGVMAYGEMTVYKGRMVSPANPVRAMELCDSLGKRLLYPIRFDVEVGGWNN